MELQRFLSFIDFHRRFVPKYAVISAPLHQLLVAALKAESAFVCEDHARALLP